MWVTFVCPSLKFVFGDVCLGESKRAGSLNIADEERVKKKKKPRDSRIWDKHIGTKGNWSQ